MNFLKRIVEKADGGEEGDGLPDLFRRDVVRA